MEKLQSWIWKKWKKKERKKEPLRNSYESDLLTIFFRIGLDFFSDSAIIRIQNPDVARIDLLQTRIFGNKIYADIEIEVDGSMPLREAHKIAEVVHNSIEKTFPKVKHIMVHVNPEIDRK